jgi:prepilin-type N-terminal cleavage/methylation domain-containing protein
MRKGFTLIELIFVIVIIGLLSAIAVPKFLNLKQNAEGKAVVAATTNIVQQAAEVAVNYRDLEENTSFNLKDIVSVSGSKWRWSDDGNTTFYQSKENGTDVNISVITLHSVSPGKIEYQIDCTKFADTTTQEVCKNALGGEDSVDVNVSF